MSQLVLSQSLCKIKQKVKQPNTSSLVVKYGATILSISTEIAAVSWLLSHHGAE
jgi:hypothetical protein